MRATSLLGVFVFARALVLATHGVPPSAWAPLAYLWQDVLIVLLFAAFDAAFRRCPGAGWALYGAITLYTAVNVPVACLLATPLTWPMLRAARGTLADSITHYVNAANLARMGLVLAVGAVCPVLARKLLPRVPQRVRLAAVVAAVVCLPLGPLAVSQVRTLGLHRNVLAVLLTTALPRITPADFDADWRASPFGDPPGADLSRYRGGAAGRNVVVVHLESTAAAHLRPYGAAVDPMPNLTALARQAVRFENAYTTYPETIKSFFAAQYSRYPALDTTPDMLERVPAPALAAVLAGHGYRTGLFHSGRFAYLGMESVLRHAGYQTQEDAGAIGGDRESSFGIDEPSTVRRMLRWIDAGPLDRPFLLTYLPIAGHHPYDSPAPRPFPQDEEPDRYHNALHYADEALGQLLQGLRERGLLDKTLFVIFGDHGEAFGEHPGNRGHTLFLYEENVRVPYLIAAPGLIRDAVRMGRASSLIDTAPTVCDLLGLQIPSAYQGRSLLESRSGMALFCTEYTLGFLGLRDGRWKFIHELDSGHSLLFDLADDPGERRDVSADHPERVEAYREHLLRWAAAQKHRIITGQ